MDLEMKITRKYESGNTVQDILRKMELVYSTISIIRKNKISLKEAAKLSTAFKGSVTRQ